MVSIPSQIPGDKELLELIEQAIRDGVTELDLSRQGLTRVPPEIGQLTNLTKLNLSSNLLSMLPKEIGQLTNLTTLNLCSNRLSTLPKEIGQLTNLTRLNLGLNYFYFLIKEIISLKNIVDLKLRGNQFSVLPKEIGQLTNLTRLYLGANQIDELNENITDLKNITILELDGNKLSTLPKEIGQLTNLTTLDLSSNRLSTLPPTIGQLINLTTLNLSSNELSDLPPEIGELSKLEDLKIIGNKLNKIPTSIFDLHHLIKLEVSSNNISDIPLEIERIISLNHLDLRDNSFDESLKYVYYTSNPRLIIERYKVIKAIKYAKNNFVTELHISDRKLTPLPTEIGQLTNLTALHYRNNQLAMLPPEIGHLTNLTTLDLQENELETLPPEIGQLTNLTTLDLHGNQLETLPPEIGQLTNLSTLDLHGNQLSTLPPAIGLLTNLTTLDLHGNQLSTLPPEIGQLTNLSRLDLHGNQLSTLPPAIGLLTNLSTLDLHGNQLSTLPPAIGQLTNLSRLDLHGNQLSTLTPAIGQLTNLTTLDLRDNQLSTLPPEINQLSNLTTLDLRGNLLPLPPEILENTNNIKIIIAYYQIIKIIKLDIKYNAKTIDLSKRELTKLPPEIGQLTNLTTLDLSENLLRTVPPEIGQLTNLTTLDLSENLLRTVPPKIAQLTNLTTLDLSENRLKTVPLEIGQLTNLTTLDLSENLLRTVPPKIEQLTNLITLDLSENQLRTVPPEIGQLTNFITLDLSKNQLRTVPPEIRQLTNLTTLDLSWNSLRELPPEIGQLSNLTTLDLRYNSLPLPDEILRRTNEPHLIIEYYQLFILIEKAVKDEVTKLDISGRKLRLLPAEIKQLTNLTAFYSRNNKLSTLPPEIGQLTNLTTLDLSENQLSTLPPEIGQLTNLTTLHLQWNQLSMLPPEIGQLTNLTTLHLHNNRLSTLPPAIGQLTNLTTLDLHGNQLSSLPPEIGQLTNLTTLDLHGNRLTELPPEIGQLTNLTTLDFSGNTLSTLPEEIGQLINLTTLNLHSNKLRRLPAQIGQLTNLTTLNLHSNQFSRLPAQIGQLIYLMTLDLSDNQLTRLPPEMVELTRLIYLDLNKNKNKNKNKNAFPIPPEIMALRNEPTTIIEYYLTGRKKPLNEAKLILVGQGGAGKTSIVKRIIENEFNSEQNTTKGVNITSWLLNIPSTKITSENKKQIKINIWDFGGQEIMHATHQFFLTERTLYLLVLDARLGEKSSRLHYWLKLIQSFGADSPIIVVINKIDLFSLSLNQHQLMEKYSTIKAVVETSCKTPKGIGDLKEHITAIIDQLEHVGDLIPLEWLDVKADLEKIDKNYIPYQEYVRLCEENYIRNEETQRLLIRLLHDLGVVLNFQDDPRLRDSSILNPNWVTDGVYKIINAKLLNQSQGVLEIGQLDEILDRNRYPREMHLFIIELMRKFELCFDLEGHTEEKFLLPNLLPKQEPELNWPTDGLNFEYHYNFLSESVISRFIVRMHPFIFQDTYWGNGVVLVNNKNKALVKAAPERNQISISIIGEPASRRAFWAMIREEFEVIHTSIKGLNADTKILIRGHKGVTINYQFLRKLQQEGVKVHRMWDGDEMVKVNVWELLGEVKPKSKPVDLEKITNLKRILKPLRLRVHPQKFYEVAFLLGQLYYEEMADYTLARQALVDAHQAIEALRSLIKQKADQEGLSAESARLYEMLVQCYLVEGDKSKAFEYAAVAKGRAFVNTLARTTLDLRTVKAQRPAFAQKLKEVRQTRQKIKKLESNSSLDQDKRRGRQDVLLREEAELWRELEREYPLLTAMLSVPALSVEQAGELVRALDATLVEYYRHAGGWCAFVVSKEANGKPPVRYVPLPEVNSALLGKLVEWRNELYLPAGRSKFRDRRLGTLYEAAIAPLGLTDKRVVIAPFERLHFLPLSAAYNVEGKRYMAQAHTLSFVPCLTALHVVNQERKLHQLSDKATERLLSVAYSGPPHHYLPHVLPEAKAIVKRLSEMVTIGILHQADATPTNVIREAPGYDMIHFGCHGRFDVDNPQESGLKLAGESVGAQQDSRSSTRDDTRPLSDSYLTVQRIITELDLKQTRLVTLAACLTGEIKLQQGEEHVGLLQAMMTAGTQTVVASLWRVDDAATRFLFEAFYYQEAHLHSAPQAMRYASHFLRLRKKWSHPYYWAAFQVNGLPPLPKKSVRVEWPADLLQNIEKEDNEQRNLRSMMSEQNILKNAEVLLKTMREYRSEILPALRQHRLPDKIAQQQMEASPLNIAQALHYIIQDNPTLHEAFPDADVGKIRISKSQDKDTRVSRQQQKKAMQVTNTLSDIGAYLDIYLELEEENDSSSEHDAQSLLKRFVAGFYAFISIRE